MRDLWCFFPAGQVWWFQSSVLWSNQMEGFRQMAMKEERSMRSLSWSGRISSSHSWWRRLCLPWDTPTHLLHKPRVSPLHAPLSICCVKDHLMATGSRFSSGSKNSCSDASTSGFRWGLGRKKDWPMCQSYQKFLRLILGKYQSQEYITVLLASYSYACLDWRLETLNSHYERVSGWCVWVCMCVFPLMFSLNHPDLN